MRFRFRIGPFTFGRKGTRLSLWSGGTGLSVPLSKKGQSFGKIRIGPFSWFFRGSSTAHAADRRGEAGVDREQELLGSYEDAAIAAFRSDREFLKRLRRGLPWRGVQERLKEEIPDTVLNPDKIAYGLVPKAMDAVFGQQETGWKTEKRPSKSGNGYTTWIVIIESGG